MATFSLSPIRFGRSIPCSPRGRAARSSVAPGSETIEATEGVDTILGEGGNDLIYADRRGAREDRCGR
jgi:hypothetical protein